MMIDKISGVTPLNTIQSTRKTSSVATSKAASDTISVSEEAKAMADAYYLNEVKASTPDVRADLVEQVKAKIQDPNYLTQAVIGSTADALLASFGL